MMLFRERVSLYQSHSSFAILLYLSAFFARSFYVMSLQWKTGQINILAYRCIHGTLTLGIFKM